MPCDSVPGTFGERFRSFVEIFALPRDGMQLAPPGSMKISAFAGLALVLLAPPVFAGATLPPRPSLVMYPHDTQTGVPIDVEPLIQGSPLEPSDLGSVQVAVKSEHGEDVPVSVDVDSENSAIVIRPQSELAVNTTYAVTITFDVSLEQREMLTSSFTTGAGPLDAAPQPVSAVVQHWWSPAGSSEDWAGQGTCIGLGSDDLVEVRSTVVGDIGTEVSSFTPGFYSGAFNVNAMDGPGYAPPCFQLRRRALNGSFSEPTVACGSLSPIYVADGAQAQSACTETGMVGVESLDSYAQALPPADLSKTHSCSITQHASSSSSPRSAVSLLILGVLLRCRRARRST